MKIYNLESTLSFGKFKGKTLSEILSIQPSYIKWCIMNLDHFVLPQDVLEQITLQYSSFKLSDVEENKRLEKELKWSKEHQVDYDDDDDNNLDYHKPHKYSSEELENGDWDYDPMNPAHSRSENPWIDVFGPGDEAEAAFWNTD